MTGLSLPEGVRILPNHDRSELILGAIDTLKTPLIELSCYAHYAMPPWTHPTVAVLLGNLAILKHDELPQV
jgi:hypothetical protein